MEPGSRYFKQVELLVQMLPLVAKQECFALKGGTAINLFVRDLLRLSVDIDLFAGKLCAALSRQHPRDLFDVFVLLSNEGITEGLLEVFLVYLVCGNRPIAEMLAPTEQNFKQSFLKDFQGMTNESISLETLQETRKQLVAEINKKMKDEHKQFLLSLKRGEPDWELLNRPELKYLPAVQWKLHNIRKMPKQKHQAALNKLEKILYGER